MMLFERIVAAGIASLLLPLGPSAEAQTCVPPPAGMVGWWTGNGSAVDSALGNNGQLGGNTSFQPAVVGQGFKFDGAGDYVEIPDSFTLKPANVTVEAWVRLDSLITTEGFPGLQYIVFKKNTRVFNFEAYALRKQVVDEVHRFVFSMGDITGLATLAVAKSTTPVVVGDFYHVVGTYDGSQVRLYVNGALEGEEPVDPAFSTIDYGTRPVFIGASGEAFEGKWNGIIDEATIYNRALDAGEVGLLFAAGSAGKCVSVTGQLMGLAQYVQGLNVAAGISNSLDAKLQTALKALDDANAGKTPSVCNRMRAFLNEVAAQSGHKLTEAQAAQLTAMASQIRTALACQ